MAKKLSEMTLEELWKLFPIELRPHDPEWEGQYARQERELRRILPPDLVYSIDHIGSTAVESIMAKPIVDILVRLNDADDREIAAAALMENGYLRMNRTSFNLGYTEHGFADEVFHIHIRERAEDDEIYFRDRLRELPEVAREYEKLKLSLWKQFEFDRDGYTGAKTEFVRRETGAAKMGFEFIENTDFSAHARRLFGILSENGCAGMGFDRWYSVVGAGMRNPARRIILMRYKGELAGFFQYYVNDDTFMMEEIQILPRFRHDHGLFRGLYGFVLPHVGENARRVRAFSEKTNAASQAILARLGLKITGEDGGFYTHEGTLDALKNWYRG